MQLNENETQLVNQIGFDPDVVSQFKKATNASIMAYESASQATAGIAARVADGQAAESIMKTLQPGLIQRGYRAFWTHLRDGSGLRIGDAIVVLHSTDHFAMLDAAEPCAEGHRGPEIIREKLKAYARLCDFEIVGAAADWVAVTFKSLPDDLCAFAEDIYLFCPDSCDLNSGIGSGRKFTKEVRVAAKALCPGISDGFREKHKAKYEANLAGAGFPDDFYDTRLNDAEKSVRLLAWKLKTEMYFFFWWD